MPVTTTRNVHFGITGYIFELFEQLRKEKVHPSMCMPAGNSELQKSILARPKPTVSCHLLGHMLAMS